MVTMGLPLRVRAPLFTTLGQPLHGIGHWIEGLRRARISSGVALLGACRTWSAESVLEERRSQNRPQRAQFLPDLQPNSQAIGQKDGVLEERLNQKWGAAVDLQPAISKSDRLLNPTVELAEPPTACRHGSRVLGSVRSRSARPLRVLCQPQHDTGRLALAGRMADVCAELDRLVQQQACLNHAAHA